MIASETLMILIKLEVLYPSNLTLCPNLYSVAWIIFLSFPDDTDSSSLLIIVTVPVLFCASGSGATLIAGFRGVF
jgi:hypothetical protein